MNKDQVKRVLDVLYINYDNFKKKEPTAFDYINQYNQMMADKIYGEITSLQDYINGNIEYDQLPVDVKIMFCDIPADFTKGT